MRLKDSGYISASMRLVYRARVLVVQLLDGATCDPDTGWFEDHPLSHSCKPVSDVPSVIVIST